MRISQYENGARTPNEPLLNSLAKTLEVSPHAINEPNIDIYLGLMYTQRHLWFEN